MDKLYAIKIRQSDGTYGAAIPVSVLAENVDWNSTLSLVDILGQVDTSASIQNQINNLKNTRATQASVNALDQKVDNAVEFITHNTEIAEMREKIASPGYYEGLTVEIGTYTNEEGEDTTYYIVAVPPTDPDGDLIPVTAACDPNTTPLIHAQKDLTTVTVNSSLDYENYTKVPAVIHNGEIIREATFDLSTLHPYAVYLGLDANRVPHEYPCTTSASTMIADGIQEASIAFFRLIENGVMVDLSSLGLVPKLLRVNPRMAIFTKSDNTLCFFACDGRDGSNEGLTPSEMATIMLQHGAVQAWNLDGGGSTSLVVKGSKLNHNIDGNGTRDRAVIVTWNVPHKFVNTAIQKAFANMGVEKQRIIQQLMPEIHTNGMLTVTGASLHALNDGMYYVANATDAPTSSDDGFAQVFKRYATDILIKKVFWYPYRQNTIWMDTYDATTDTWAGWVEVDYKFGFLGNGVVIPNNSNLNDYLTPGNYRIINKSSADTISNVPIQRGGRLVVEYVINNTSIKQTYYDIYGNQYFRYYTGNFSMWVNLTLGKCIETTIGNGKTVRISGIQYSAGMIFVSGHGAHAYGNAVFVAHDSGLHLMNVDTGTHTTIALSNNGSAIDVINGYAESAQWLTIMIFNNAGQTYNVTVTEL